jgi:hypothetical protein
MRELRGTPGAFLAENFMYVLRRAVMIRIVTRASGGQTVFECSWRDMDTHANAKNQRFQTGFVAEVCRRGIAPTSEDGRRMYDLLRSRHTEYAQAVECAVYRLAKSLYTTDYNCVLVPIAPDVTAHVDAFLARCGEDTPLGAVAGRVVGLLWNAVELTHDALHEYHVARCVDDVFIAHAYV